MKIYEVVVTFVEPTKSHGMQYVVGRYAAKELALHEFTDALDEWEGPNIAAVTLNAFEVA